MNRPSLRRPVLALALLATAGPVALSACSVGGTASGAAGDTVTITVGYQSKTINTVTAGTLLKAKGYFEEQLAELGTETGTTYKVDWQDYDTGAPITANMMAGKIDIGSMGDFPLLINGTTGENSERTHTELVAITGYNVKGALNGVVVPEKSSITGLEDLKGKTISASVGSAGHGTLVRALDGAGIDPVKDVSVENQQPAVGASALQAGSVDAISQFVAWPGFLAFRDNDRLVYDGGALDVPTFHGTVVRSAFADASQDVVEAFLAAQVEATTYLHDHPVEAAETVAKEAGLPAEVVYLYNGRNGISTFDTTIKPELRAALEDDLPFLKSIKVTSDSVDFDRFVNDSYLRDVLGDAYDEQAGSLANPAPITGRDEVCDKDVADAATASEVWVQGEKEPRVAADPTCLLRAVAALDDEQVRASYVPDALTGTRWFADRSVWLRAGDRLLPFATQDNADAWRAKNPGATPVTFDQALAAAEG